MYLNCFHLCFLCILQISENLFADVVVTASRIGEKNFSKQSMTDLVKATENIINHVELDENKTIATFETPIVFAQVSTNK